MNPIKAELPMGGKAVSGWKLVAYYVAGVAAATFLFFVAIYWLGQQAVDHKTEIIGQTIFSKIHNDYLSLMRLDEQLVSQSSGQNEYQFTVERGGGRLRKLVSWNTVKLGDQNLVIVLSTPVTKIKVALYDFRPQYFLLGGLLLFTLLGISLFFFGLWRQHVHNKAAKHLLQEVETRTEALSASESRYRTLVENAPLGILLCDTSGKIATLNSAFLDIIAAPSANAAMDMNLLTSPSFVKAGISDSVSQCIQQNKTLTKTHRYTSQWDKTTDINLFIAPIQDDAGVVTGAQALIQDITTLKQAEESIKAERNLLRTLIDNLPDTFIFVKDTESKFITTNAPHLRTLGQEKIEDVAGKTDFEFFPPEFAEQYYATEQAVFQSGQPLIDHEEPGKDKQNNITWRLTTKVPLKDTQGEITGLVGISQNITALKQTQAALKESEQALQTLLNSITDYVWSADIVDEQIKYRYYSPVVQEITGYPPEYFMGGVDQWLNIIHPNDRAESRQKIEQEVLGNLVTHEYRIVNPNGQIIWLHGTTSPTFDENGAVIRLQGVVSDITERKQAEQILTGQNQILEIIVKGTPLPDVLENLVLFVEAQLDDTLCSVLLLDESKTKLLYGAAPSLPDGYNQAINGITIGPNVISCGTAAYLGEPIFVSNIATDPLWVDYKELALEHNLHACWSIPIFSTEGDVAGTFAMYHKHPHTPTNQHIRLVNLSTHLASIAIEREQTESTRQKLEQQLLQSQKMEAIGTLAGGIAHDFNNLLTAIFGYGELAVNSLPIHSPALNDIESILTTAQRAAGLTRQLLAFARRQIIEPHVIDLNQLVLNTGGLLRRLIGEDIELVIEPVKDLWLVKVDSGQFEQVLINLAVNARDAMPNGGKLDISTNNISLTNNFTNQHVNIPPGEYVRLTVADNGIGINNTIKAHLFEPFFTTKEAGKGSGLGLATCFGIIKQHHGYIWIESRPNQGTTVNIYIPRTRQPNKQPVNTFAFTETNSLPLGRETILLVEDEEAVRYLIFKVLQQRGYTVLEAGNGIEAMDLVEQMNNTKIDLLITDMVMPKMGGKALALQLKPLFSNLKILYISGYTNNVPSRQELSNPNSTFLQKPFTPNTLAQMVRQILDKS